MGPKAKEQPRVLTRDELLTCMPVEDADELLANAAAESRGATEQSVEMTPDEFERWIVDGPDDPFSKG